MGLLRGLLINLVVPATGLCIYLWLCWRMRNSAILQPPYIPLFVLFSAYGGWLMILLTIEFWEWSGMASLGAIALVTITPIVMLAMAIYLFTVRQTSAYHYSSYVASIAYIGFILALVAYLAIFVW